MKAMILAAGFGTRLRPLTNNLPKALVPVGGKPMIDYVIDRLQSAGYDDITINVHHFAEKLSDYLRENYSADDVPGAKGFHISKEISILDTGGGIFRARRFLEGSGNFLVHNVDIFSNLNLEEFRSKVRPEALATLAVSDRDCSKKLLFDRGMRLVGWKNLLTGEIRTPYEHLGRYYEYAFSGIHILSDEVFKIMEDDSLETFSIIDFYLRYCSQLPIYGVDCERLRLLDLGTPEAVRSLGTLIQTLRANPI